MKNPSDKYTHGDAMSAVEFRAKATGVGNSCEVSLRTGLLRSQRVAAHSTASATVLAAAGYPTPEDLLLNHQPGQY
jgi:hypothetical protein